MFSVGTLSMAQVKDSIKQNYYPYNYNNIDFYTIYNINVTGTEHFNPLLVKLYSNLSIGQEIKIPGNAIPKAIENLWKQGLFSDVKIGIDTIINDQVSLNIIVKERNKLSGFYINGLDRSEARSLREELLLKKDIVVTKELKVRTKNTIRNFFQEKGYYNVKVDIKEYNDTAIPNYNFMRIFINKGKRVKIKRINYHGNSELSDKELNKAMKKTNQLYKKINIFKSSKFISDEFKNDKKGIEQLYANKGYRDAYIKTDSIRKAGDGRIVLDIYLHEGKQYFYRDINFVGNSKYRNGILDTVLGINKGDIYNPALLEEKLYYSPTGLDVSSLYMNDGYLFFQVNPMEIAVEGDSIDIEIRINEGKQAIVNRVNIIGNDKTSDFVILRELRTLPGNKFSRNDIQRSIQEINRLGYFDPESIGVNPVPNPSAGTVDITYNVAEKPSDQIELSGGWGGNGGFNQATQQFNSGLVGTLGLSLTNFSTRKLFKGPRRGDWSPLPAGDGQRLTLRAQSNGISFQTYTFSFSEPWLGGKKPTSLTFSANHSVNNWGAFQNRVSKFSTTNISLGLGKRVKWPDDFFSVNAGISFIRYNLDSFSFGIPNFIEDGNSNAFELRLGLSRFSTDDQIFPTTGSTIDFGVQLTPPLSILNNKDYDNIGLQEKYKWIEYHKWKFNAAHFTELRKNLVLASSVRFGFLGGYNSQLGITGFERFWVGGNALQGFNLAGREFISQRGYGSNSQGMISENAISNEFPTTTARDLGSTIYNRFTMELRYAISKGQSATIYPLVFFEAGNAWINPRNFNPFEIKKAVGAGVRFFLPMFGLIGIDYGYGLDINTINPNLTNGQRGYVHFFLGPQF